MIVKRELDAGEDVAIGDEGNVGTVVLVDEVRAHDDVELS